MTSATSGGNISDDGGDPITARGVCWNTFSNPELSDSLIVDSLGLGSFDSNIKNLEVDTKYYLRAYATNEVGTGYGNEISFTTRDGIPEITTVYITNLTAVSTVVGGEIIDDGGLAVIEKGI